MVKSSGFFRIDVVRRHVDASAKPARPIAQRKVAHIHVDNRDVRVVGVQHQTHPCRPKPVGFGVHLGLERGRSLSFHLAEVDPSAFPNLPGRQHAGPSAAAAGAFPSIFHESRPTMLGFHGLNAVNNAVLQGLKVCGERLKLR